MPLCSHLTLNSNEYLECYVRHSAGTGCFFGFVVDVVVFVSFVDVVTVLGVEL